MGEEKKMEIPVKAVPGHRDMARFFKAPLPCACVAPFRHGQGLFFRKAGVRENGPLQGGKCGRLYSGWASVLGIQTGVFWKVLA